MGLSLLRTTGYYPTIRADSCLSGGFLVTNLVTSFRRLIVAGLTGCQASSALSKESLNPFGADVIFGHNTALERHRCTG